MRKRWDWTKSKESARIASMRKTTRRDFLRTAAVGAVALGACPLTGAVQVPGGRRPSQVADVEVLHPRGRVPLSLFVDDSTCLVNLAHYAMPQFAAAWLDRVEYQQSWRNWPRCSVIGGASIATGPSWASSTASE